ncbi:unnamed protein product [Allacma fusca]|uniref:Uncharacterized protein n=1 Tax=Allacma fusca TaxID=39272 RepID=A0A8J2KT92_9HEXA|nr:unnamed protein product [Allacma fusca]
MGRGIGKCTSCQPCGICGIPLQVGSIIAAIFYMLDGFATLAVIFYDVAHIQKQTTPKMVDSVLIAIILFATMLWIVVSILLLIGALARNRCLVSLFLLGIVIINLVILIVMIVAVTTFTQDDYAKPRLVFYGTYGYGLIWTLLQWYFYWVAYAFLVELTQPGEPRGDEAPREQSHHQVTDKSSPSKGAPGNASQKSSVIASSRDSQRSTVELDEIKPPPELLRNLMSHTHIHFKNFFDDTRSFNSALAFASMVARIATPKYAQLYILDPDEALRTRMAVDANKDCNENLMHELAQLLSAINNYAKAYKMMHEVEQEETDKAHQEGRPPREITMSIHIDKQSDRRRYNAPRFTEVAVIFRSDKGEPPFERDICIYSRLHTKGIAIHQAILNNDVNPMVYPILFPHCDRGGK